VVKRVVGR